MSSETKHPPLSPKDAMDEVRERAKSKNFNLYYTFHAKERMAERNITISDVLYILENGTIFDEGTSTTQPKYHNYKIVSRSPNSSRDIAVVIIMQSERGCLTAIKIKTVMWVDKK